MPPATLHPTHTLDELDAGTRIAAGLRAVANIGKAWQLSAEEIGTLLGVSRATYFRLKDKAELARTAPKGEGAAIRESLVSQPLRERLSLILGIYGGLQLYYANNRAYGESWVRRPNSNPVFGGRAPIELLLSGNVLDLDRVRRYVDAMRG